MDEKIAVFHASSIFGLKITTPLLLLPALRA